MKTMLKIGVGVTCVLSLWGCQLSGRPSEASAEAKVENIFLVTLDGLRWQEVFRGLDESLAANNDYTERSEEIKDAFWTDNKDKRAELLMPFLHHTVFRNGTVVGDRDKNSCAHVTNPWYVSYPGYSEILTGIVDETLDSNERVQNPNESFLEKLNANKRYQGKVAAFTSWDVFPYILNVERSGLPLNAAQKADPATNELERILNRLQDDIPRLWQHARFDAFTHHFALSYIRSRHPQIVYIGYDAIDEFGHDAKYDQYLMAAHRTDRFINEIWQLIQSDADYRDKTVLFITTDHGRGEKPEETWRHHGSERYRGQGNGIVGSDEVWMAAIGPGIPDHGLVATGDECLTSNRIAATLLKLLGEDYRLFNPKMGPPMPEFLQ